MIFASEKEEHLVKSISPWLHEKCVGDNPCWNPARTGEVYDLMAMICFKENQQGKNVESLRTIVNLFSKGLVRGSKEFDDLIKL